MAPSSRPSLKVFDYKVPRRLLGAQFLSEVGDWAARGALQILVLERTHSTAWSALVFSVSLAAWIGPGQVVSSRLEHLDKRRVMVGCDVVRAAIYATLLIRMPIGGVVALLFVAGLATPVFESNRSALLRRCTPPEIYPSALSVASVIIQISLVIGYLSGSWTVTVAGPGLALTANVISFAASAVLLTGLPTVDSLGTKDQHFLRGSAALLARDVVLRWAVLLLCAAAMTSVAIEAVVASYVLHHLGARTGWVGVSLASVAVGTLLATVGVPFGTGPRRQLVRGAVTTLIAAAGCVTLLWLDLSVPWVLLAFALGGAMLGCGLPCNVVLGTRIPPRVQATAISVVQGSVMAAQALGATVGGLLSEQFGERSSCIAAASCGGALALVFLVRIPRGSAFRQEVRIPGFQEVVTSSD